MLAWFLPSDFLVVVSVRNVTVTGGWVGGEILSRRYCTYLVVAHGNCVRAPKIVRRCARYDTVGFLFCTLVSDLVSEKYRRQTRLEFLVKGGFFCCGSQ